MKTTEAEVAAALVAYLEDAGHDVYQEVEYRGAIIDIVALAGPEVWAIETKLQMSLELLRQCVDRKNLVHRVFCGVPAGKAKHELLFLQNGIGTFQISLTGRYGTGGGADISLRHMPPRLTSDHRWPRQLKALLSDHYKTHAKAGSQNGAGRWTPFRETCERLQYEVQRNPGILLKAAIESITTHYSSARTARSSLAKWIERKKVPGVELRRENGGMHLYPI